MGNFKSSLIDGQLKVTNGITGALNGNASSATKATQDSDGNKINATYLKLSGGAMTGNISYNMNSSTQIPFKVYGGDVNGQGISVGAGGATIIGSGESAKACESLLTATTEELWVTSDNAIKFYTNCQTIGNKVGVFLNASRAFYPDTNNTGTLGTSSNKWNNVYATTFTGNLSGNATNVTQKKSLTGKSHSNYGINNGYLPDMSFIAFWNGAYNSSNNSNLTYAHQGIIQCKPTTLYSNASGTTGTIKLSQTAANFSYLEIFYCDNNNKQHHSIKISEPNNKLTSLDTGESYENDKNLYFRTTSYTISGTSMTVKSYGYMNFWQVSGSDHCGVNPEKNNYIKIIKVLGYK